MRTIKREEYTKLNKALYDLEDILGSMGVKEFSLSRDKHNFEIDPDTENIDPDLLQSFCSKIAQIHDTRFGRRFIAEA